MSLTVTDLFCGAGGSSLGAQESGMRLVMAANHWKTAIDVHQAHFPDAAHDTADISQVDPRRYPRTDVLLASPECTNHSQARGVSRKRQQPSLWDAPDPAAERSRATMWDVPRFAEQLRYDAIVVENVVEATKWVGWRGWILAMTDLGYEHRVLSHNSQDHDVPQSRDRIYVVFWRRGAPEPDLEMEQHGWCAHCEADSVCRQSWNLDRWVGRWRQQWRWRCVGCHDEVEPTRTPAAEIIDWSLPCPRIGDRARPLADATRRKILTGLQRHGWAPIVTAGAGNTEMVTPTSEPVRTIATAGHQSLLVPYYGTGVARTAGEPVGTMTTRDKWALVDPDAVVDDCGFRMLQPAEIELAMAFPGGYIPTDVTKRERVKLAGNAVTPPVMRWITGRVAQALEGHR